MKFLYVFHYLTTLKLQYRFSFDKNPSHINFTFTVNTFFAHTFRCQVEYLKKTIYQFKLLIISI
uniref:Uncharacterized protein n=1 Tax=Arion vulgaris TaxID=1028688 RepID=A0A0B7AGG8_9EUPU